MGRPKRYATESEKQAAYRERKKSFPVTKSESTGAIAGVAPKSGSNLPVPVLAEPDKCHEHAGETRVAQSENDHRIASENTSRGGQSFSYDKKKYPNRGAWEIAVERVERAVRWAEKFPERIGADDLKFQTLDWQYQNEGLKAPAS